MANVFVSVFFDSSEKFLFHWHEQLGSGCSLGCSVRSVLHTDTTITFETLPLSVSEKLWVRRVMGGARPSVCVPVPLMSFILQGCVSTETMDPAANCSSSGSKVSGKALSTVTILFSCKDSSNKKLVHFLPDPADRVGVEIH